MRSLSVCKPLVVAFISTAVVTAAPRTGWADDKAACGAAYDQTQIQRRAGKLLRARDAARVCQRDTCAAFVRTDCTTWLAEIEKALPTVTLDVQEGGAAATDVHVSLDGDPWTDSVDPAPRPLDPGSHSLRFEKAGFAPVERTIELKEGDRGQVIHVELHALSSGPVASTADEMVPKPKKRSVGPWVVGGVGLVGLGAGAALGAATLAEKSTVDGHCRARGSSWVCDAAGRSATDNGKVFGPLSTAAFVVGGLGLGVAAVWLWTSGHPKSDSASPGVALVTIVNVDSGALRVDGRF